jgi:hypothetical protein
MLARRLPPLLYAVVRSSMRVLPLWRRAQHLTHGQPLTVRRYVPRYGPRHSVAFPGTPRRMVRSLAVAGCFLLILALGLPEAASLATGEMVSLLRGVALGSGASPVLSRAAEHPLTTTAHLASPPAESFTTDDYDMAADSSDMSPLVLKAHVLPRTAVCSGCNASRHCCLWPTHYLERPQLLTRL